MGSTGDSPVPVGDSPTGRSRRLLSKGPSLLPPGALPVPSGESPGGTGLWPVLPRSGFPERLSAEKHGRGSLERPVLASGVSFGCFLIGTLQTKEVISST